MKLVQKVKLLGLPGTVRWKLSLGQALPLVKVSKYIHPLPRLQSEI